MSSRSSPASPPRSRCASDFNEVVREAIAVFHGRLDGISIRTAFDDSLPPVNLDREQFQRVVVNLIDNAAEAMQDSLVKELYICHPARRGERGAGGCRFRTRRQLATIRRSSSCPTFPPRIAAPAWVLRL